MSDHTCRCQVPGNCCWPECPEGEHPLADQTHAGDAGREDEPVAWQAMDDDLNAAHAVTASKGCADIWAKAGIEVRPLYARRAPAPGDADAAWAEEEKCYEAMGVSPEYILSARNGFYRGFCAGHAANAGGTSDAVAAVERLMAAVRPVLNSIVSVAGGKASEALSDLRHVMHQLETTLPAPTPTDPEPAQPDRDAVIETIAVKAEADAGKSFGTARSALRRFAKDVRALRTGAAR